MSGQTWDELRTTANTRKLTMGQAEDIRRLYVNGIHNQPALGRLYGVDQCTISSIVNHRSYQRPNLTAKKTTTIPTHRHYDLRHLDPLDVPAWDALVKEIDQSVLSPTTLRARRDRLEGR